MKLKWLPTTVLDWVSTVPESQNGLSRVVSYDTKSYEERGSPTFVGERISSCPFTPLPFSSTVALKAMKH